jgi:hypothetical protein
MAPTPTGRGYWLVATRSHTPTRRRSVSAPRSSARPRPDAAANLPIRTVCPNVEPGTQIPGSNALQPSAPTLMFEFDRSPVWVKQPLAGGAFMARNQQRETTLESNLKLVTPRSRLKGHEYLLLTAERGLLPASCWCERSIVAVTPSDVLAGRTASCRRPACNAPGPSTKV